MFCSILLDTTAPQKMTLLPGHTLYILVAFAETHTEEAHTEAVCTLKNTTEWLW